MELIFTPRRRLLVLLGVLHGQREMGFACKKCSLNDFFRHCTMCFGQDKDCSAKCFIDSFYRFSKKDVSHCISSNAAAGRWNKEGTVKVSGTQFGRCLPSASKRCPRGVPFGRFFLFVLSPRRPIWSGRQAGSAGSAGRGHIYGTWDPQRWDHCVTVSHLWSCLNQNTCSADIEQHFIISLFVCKTI